MLGVGEVKIDVRRCCHFVGHKDWNKVQWCTSKWVTHAGLRLGMGQRETQSCSTGWTSAPAAEARVELNRLGMGANLTFLACCTVGCRSHMAPGFTEFPFPKHLFHKFIQEDNGELQGSWRGPHPLQLPDCALHHTVALAGVPSCSLVPEA